MFITGRVTGYRTGEGHETVALSSSVYTGEDDTIAYLLDERFYRKTRVYAAYAFSNRPITKQSLLVMAVEQIDGEVEAKWGEVYSEITGYLWTDDEGKIGGHDMVQIFTEHIGEFGCLIVQTEPIDLMELCDE